MVVPERPLLALHNRNITVVVQDQQRVFGDRSAARAFSLSSLLLQRHKEEVEDALAAARSCRSRARWPRR